MAAARRPGRCGVVGCLVLVLGLVLAAGAAGQSTGAAPGQVVGVAVHALGQDGPTLVTHKVPLLEVFTATWCPPCAPADRAIDRLLDERSPAFARGQNGTAWPDASAPATALAVLAYHPHPDLVGEDRFGIPEGHHRLAAKHGAFWFPSVYVDGVHEAAAQTRALSVDAGMEMLAYQRYTELLALAEAVPPAVHWNVSSSVQGDTVRIVARITGVAAVDDVVFVQGALWEDHVHFAGSNGVDDHRMTVRAMLPREVRVEGVAPGDEWLVEWTVQLPAEVDPAAAGVTLFVETAWSNDKPDDSGAFMAYAAGVAGVAAASIVVMRVRRGGA